MMLPQKSIACKETYEDIKESNHEKSIFNSYKKYLSSRWLMQLFKDSPCSVYDANL